jgi:hypothetical protein
MKRIFFIFLLGVMVLAVAVGCSRPTDVPEKSEDELAAATATVQAELATLPADVPIHPNAEQIKFAASNTSISYIVTGDLDTLVDYYRTELETQGWEKRGNSPENPIGDAQTLLRVKPDKNISVTIQSIPESDQVRVLLTLILK